MPRRGLDHDGAVAEYVPLVFVEENRVARLQIAVFFDCNRLIGDAL
jgi:hypothetical protein